MVVMAVKAVTITTVHNRDAAERNGGLHLADGNVTKLVLEVKGVGLDTTEKVVPGEGVLGPQIVKLKFPNNEGTGSECCHLITTTIPSLS